MKNSRLFISIALMIISIFSFAQNQPLLNLKYEQNYTPTYSEVIEMYQLLDSKYENAKLVEKGLTDVGKPLHTFIINSESCFVDKQRNSSGRTGRN